MGNQLYGAKRAANLQRLISGSFVTPQEIEDNKTLGEKFKAAFGVHRGEEMLKSLILDFNYNVSDWLESLDWIEQDEILIQEYFNFLN